MNIFLLISIVSSIFIVVFGIWFVVSNIKKYNKEQKREKENFANENGFESNEDFKEEISLDFKLLKYASKRSLNNVIKKDNILICDYRYSTGKNDIFYTVLQYKLEKDVPDFILIKNNIFYKFLKIFGYKNIEFEHYPKFSNKYLLRGYDDMRIKSFFSDDKLMFFEQLEDFDNIEVKNNLFMTYKYKIEYDMYNDFIEKIKRIIDLLGR